ncbi:CMRF35-like molecule 9 isoform X3 [Siphateles boraxobius]|uniref:CMRF35-like molecule 9 isoform X3 n=1 Tax=Siphateles boraxobius TaxID=180520 RepID=UPI00406335CD
MGSLLKMKFFSFLWLWIFLSEFKTSTTGGISGYTGRYIIIPCSHKWASSNIKYFCRDPCGARDILVKSDRSPEGRYTLEDSGTGTFYVNITDLQESDSGIYWCGVQRFGKDTYQEVNLTVSKDNTKNLEEVTHLKMTETQTNPWKSAEIKLTTPRHSVSISLTTKDSPRSLTSTVHVHFILYAAAGLVVMLIISSVGLVTCQWRKRVEQSRFFTAGSTYNERHSEEAIGVYANIPDDRPYAAINKSSIKSKDKSQSDPIYQNLHFNTAQGDAIYANI